MPTPLRHPVHASELLELIERIVHNPQIGLSPQDKSRLIAAGEWIGGADHAVFVERDRKANLPIPTPAGDLIPGSVVNVKTDNGYGQKRTVKGAVVTANPGITEVGDGYHLIHLARGGETLRVQQRDVVEIVVVRLPTEPVHGG